jgi:hypothetical protein
MKQSTSYLAFKRINDEFIGLEDNGTLTTWSLTTAKVIESFKLGSDYDDLIEFYRYPYNEGIKVVHNDWDQDNVLLWRDLSKEESVPHLKDFFGDRFKQGLNGGKSALET